MTPLVFRDGDFTNAAAGPEASQRTSLAIFISEAARPFSAVGMDRGIHSGQRFEFVRRGDKWLSAERRQLGRHPYGIFRMGIQPGSYRRPAQRQLGKMRLTGFNVLQAMVQHRHPAGDPRLR